MCGSFSISSITVVPSNSFGPGIGAPGGPPAGWVYVYADGQQVFTGDGQAVLVPAGYAN